MSKTSNKAKISFILEMIENIENNTLLDGLDDKY